MKVEVFKTAHLGQTMPTISFKIDGSEPFAEWYTASRALTNTISESGGGLVEDSSTFVRKNDIFVKVDFGQRIDKTQTCQAIATELAARAAKVNAAFNEKYPAVHEYGCVEI